MIVDCRNISGQIDAIPSKSQAHRYMICSWLAGRMDALQLIDELEGPLSEDLLATKSCLEALAACQSTTVLNCGDSGTTLRLLLPVTLARGVKADWAMGETLSSRPIAELADELWRHGAREGQLQAGEYRMPGDVSSQYISGLLLALPLLDGDSRIIASGKLQSKPYVDMTINAMKAYGVEVSETAGADEEQYDACGANGAQYDVAGGQQYIYSDKCHELLEGDWSAAAVWLTADSLRKCMSLAGCGGADDNADKNASNYIIVRNLNVDSVQGDRQIVKILEEFEKRDHRKSDSASRVPNAVIDASDIIIDAADIVIDAADIPDIVPMIALRAAVSNGTTEIRNVGRLRYKECDRLAAIVEILGQLGADVSINVSSNIGSNSSSNSSSGADCLTIVGTAGKKLPGSKVPVRTRGDHRIVMMAAIASIVTELPVRIDESEAVRKSYQAFWQDVKSLGGIIVE